MTSFIAPFFFKSNHQFGRISNGNLESHNFAVNNLKLSQGDVRSVCPDDVSNHLLCKPHINLSVLYMLQELPKN